MRLDRDKSYHNKTHIRLKKTIRAFEVPPGYALVRLNPPVEAPPDSDRHELVAEKSRKYRGKLHDWFQHGDGVVGALHGVRVHVDGKGEDKRHQGLRAQATFDVALERKP